MMLLNRATTRASRPAPPGSRLGLAGQHSLQRRQRGWAAVFLTPAMLVIIAFVVVPIVLTFWISLHEWSMFTPFTKMRWVGLRNYTGLWADPGFRGVLRNTAVYTLLAVGITVPLALLLGMLLFFPRARGRALVRTVLFSAYVIPTVAVAIVWGILYAPGYGPFDAIAGKLGIGPLNWLSSPNLALLALAVFNIWQMLGYYTVLVVAGLTQVPTEVYEAARIDGAGPWRQTVSITVPLLSRTLTFILLVGLINAVQVFDPVYVLTQGGPANATNVLSFDIQRAAFQYGLAGQASAMAFTLLLVLVFLVATVLGARRWRAWA
jgi:ABC-type sugar transport system permease subunit